MGVQETQTRLERILQEVSTSLKAIETILAEITKQLLLAKGDAQ